MRNRNLKYYIHEIQDFPKPGVSFKDLSLLFTHYLFEMAYDLSEMFSDLRYDYIAGIDARGFIVASAMSIQTGKKFIPIRKQGKLPHPKVSITSESEYGESILEMKHLMHLHDHFQTASKRVLIMDDVLATGGTFKSAYQLCQMAGCEVVGFGSIVDLRYLNQFNMNGLTCRSLIQYD
jgi:adenine phosphoribosyltransferase